MDQNSSLLEKAGETFGYFQHYLEKRIDLFRLELTERIIRILTVLITGFLLLSIIGMFTLFASIAVAFYVGESLNSPGTGFLIVAGAYGLLALLLYIFRDTLIAQPILSIILAEFQEEMDEEEEPPVEQERPLQKS